MTARLQERHPVDATFCDAPTEDGLQPQQGDPRLGRHALVGQQVELGIGERTLEVLHKNRRVAAHAVDARRGAYTTLAEHMPASHREHAQWSPAKLVAWD